VRHRDHGVGRVEGFTESSTGDHRVLAFVRWGNTGGWYDLASESFTVLDGAKLRRFFAEWQQGLL